MSSLSQRQPSTVSVQFCVYSYNSAARSLDPSYIAPDPVILNDTAPEARWMYNLLEEARLGFQMFSASGYISYLFS
jgi:hypothetical protein